MNTPLQIDPIYGLIMQSISKANIDGKQVFFISDWNIKNNDDIYIKEITIQAFLQGGENAYDYLSTDEKYSDLKNDIIKNSNLNIFPENIAICYSGTSAIFAALSILTQECSRFLLFTPSYFLYNDILQYLRNDMAFLSCDYNRPDYTKIEKAFVENKIQVVILTDPIFAIGQAIDIAMYDYIYQLCKKYDVWLFIDGLYSGCEWNAELQSIMPNPKIEAINKYDKAIFIDSLSKRIGINGNKFALLFANGSFINAINNFQLYTFGSFTSTQLSLIKELYKTENKKYVLKNIKQLIDSAKETYALISSLILNSQFKILPSDAGYFSSLCIPYNALSVKNDSEAFNNILNRFDTITLPLSIFRYIISGHYTFRVNLLQNKPLLLKFIRELLELKQTKSF